ncbi:DUF262 domain-containing protein [Affinibrenneria salicis]|uniref:DUF262 domain-containing protein n=1 Tax=Affinibrenneria salicis TaxID=2590031 RepID=A0A5J5FV77_9GAMM|nr:DUF262 domain-containing protein [Affinibrenneria salicis]KAA8997654.1 DUF262 domain-containing protein [Affinibrenneria salicis]
MGMKELKEQLSTTSDAAEQVRIKSEIAGLVQKVDNDIRTAQKNIVYNVREWSIELVLQKYSDGLDDGSNELFIPDYQRDYKWEPRIASRFIESILLDFPIPYLYIADVNDDDPEFDGRVEIIDGSQRIRAIYYFCNDQLFLSDLKEIKELEGFTFSDLPSGRQRRFLRESLRLVELKGDVKEEHRRDLFERINSGVKRLEAMEVRHGSDAAASPFYRNVLIPCSENGLFSELAPLSNKKRSSGDHRELVLRFFAYLNALDEYKGFVREFLDEYLNKQAESVSVNNTQEYIEEFERMLEFVRQHFPIGFKKTLTSKTTPRARYEALAVGTALALRADPSLQQPVIPVAQWLFEKEFELIVTADSANNVSQLKQRINFVKNKILGE